MADVNPLLFYLANQQGQMPNILAPYQAAPNPLAGQGAGVLTPEAQQDLLNKITAAGIKSDPPPPMPIMVSKGNKKIAPRPGPSQSLAIEAPQPSSPAVPMYQSRIPFGDMDKQHELEREIYEQTKGALMQQGQGVKGLEDMRNQIAASPTQVDLSPLTSYVDSIVPNSKLTEGYKRPESGTEKQARMFTIQDAIQKAKQGLSQEEISALKEQLNSGIYKQMMAQNRMDLSQGRLSFQQEKEARATLNNDPLLKQYIPRLEGAAKIGELIGAANSGKVVRNQALLGQLNAEISRLETGSQSPGLNQSEKTELLDKAAQFSAFKDSITGNPQDAVRPEVINAAGKLVTELSSSYKRGIDSRMGYLKSGMNSLQQPIADEKHKSIKDSYGPRLGGWEDPQSPPADPDLQRLQYLRSKAAGGQ